MCHRGPSWHVQVIDEADRILEIGFEEEMRQIVALLPKDRQTMLFSATQTTKVGQGVGQEGREKAGRALGGRSAAGASGHRGCTHMSPVPLGA